MDNTTHQSSDQKPLPELRKPPDIHLSPLEEVLIRNVHAGYQEIIIEKEFRGNYGGARVFLVVPVKEDGGRDARIVTKIGPAPELRHERENYRQHVAGALPFSAARAQGYCEQGGQAALNYDFAGERVLGETVTLVEYYGAHSAEEMKVTLETLLDRALGAWYGQSHPLNRSFRDEYGHRLPSYDEMLKVVSDIFPDLSSIESDRIEIPGVDGTYPNPLKIYLRLMNMTIQGRESYVHGDLHLRNVLVDQTGKSWLIDFANVAKHHSMLDFIKLETYLRLMVLAPQHRAFSWNEYAQFEHSLNADTLGQSASRPDNPRLAKAYAVIQTIRQIARKYMGPEQDFRNEYFPALFLYCLARLKHHESNGLAATQLIFMATCVLGQFILEEREAMQTISNEGQNPSEEEQATHEGNNPNAGGRGNVSIGGNATDNIIVTGNQNTIKKTTGKVDSADEIARAFAIIMGQVNQERDSAKKEKAQKLVRKLEAEARKGEQADEDNVEDWFTVLAKTSADAWEVAVATLSNPIVGIGLAFQKIAQRAKEEKTQRGT